MMIQTGKIIIFKVDNFYGCTKRYNLDDGDDDIDNKCCVTWYWCNYIFVNTDCDASTVTQKPKYCTLKTVV